MLNNGVSLADIAAVTDRNNGGGNNGGWGNGEGWWVLIILFALFGWGGNGNWGGGSNGGGALTRGDLCQDMNFSDLEGAVRSMASDNAANFRTIDNAICNLGYNNAQLANGIQMQMANGFSGLSTDLCQLGNNIGQQFNATNVALMQGQNALASQLAQCCCENRAGQAEIKYQMATDTCAVTNTIQNSIRDLSDKLDAQYTRQLENELQAARLAASQEAQNQFLVNKLRPCPEPAYLTCNPWGGQPYGSCCNTGCGCGSY